MNSSHASIRDKIRKLLKIAECESASEAEKATALHQAARLSQKHAIDLDALGKDASAFGSTKLADFGTRSPSWCVAVSMVLIQHFNVQCFVRRMVTERGGRDASWYVFGCEPSREIAVYVWTYLKREFLRAERDLCIGRQRGKRPSFFMSLAAGVISRLDELSKKQQDEAQVRALIADRLKSEYTAYSRDFGVLRLPTIEGDRAAYLRGRQIEIRPAIPGETKSARIT